jgi:hypothetical protein
LEWNSWTEVNDLNTARRSLGGAGTNTAALLLRDNRTSLVANTESWNGTSWTEVNDLNTGKISDLARCWNSNSRFSFWWRSTSPGSGFTGATETWNGTSWTEVNDLNTARNNLAGCGTNTAALAFGGNIQG